MDAHQRKLRRQLIALWLRASEGQRPAMHPRVAATLLRQCVQLLPVQPRARRVALRASTLTHGALFRHLITIRCPDQPFYLDAVRNYLLRRRLSPLAQQTIVLGMLCDAQGCALELQEPGQDPQRNFILAALHISASAEPDLPTLIADLRAVLAGVDISVRDFPLMRRRLEKATASLASEAPQEAELLAWLIEDRFVFFGLQEQATSLGQLRARRALQRLAPGIREELATLPAARQPGLEWFVLPSLGKHLYALQLPALFRVNWREGDRLRSMLVLGRFARSARFANASRTPLLAGRWSRLEGEPALRHSAFYRREVRMLFDRAPKALLLATRSEDWLAPCMRAVDLAKPTDVVCAWLAAQPGQCHLLFVAISEARVSEASLARIRATLAGIGLRLAAEDAYTAGALRILLFVIEHPDAAAIPIARIEGLIQRAISTWQDQARAEIMAKKGGFPKRAALSALDRLPALYGEMFPPAQFPQDFLLALKTKADGRAHLAIEQRAPGAVVRILSPYPIALARLVQALGHFGLEPVEEAALSFPIENDDLAFAQMACRLPKSELHRDERLQLKRAIEAVLNEEHDDDALNTLILQAGLDVERIGALILLRNHLCQLYPEARPGAITEMMLHHPKTTAALARWFTARHLPGATKEGEEAARVVFKEHLSGITTLHDDRWFRALGALVAASLRTNVFSRTPDVPLAIKIAPRRLAGIAEPKPWREIFVHGLYVQGVHLRAGPIARGGIRFSDRAADLRTEILELMATQVVKNGQIVPTGAKGGFVVAEKSAPAFVQQQYRAYIRALLSLTDQRTPDGRVLPPAGIRVVDDKPDPYLVVAADKGTARFSDAANEEALAAGFWLGDAFASGGRHGYDHKALGITAKGAWVVGAHHFARLGRDLWRDPITAVGIGDPSGDVFGNGMLLNPNIRLIAAFNHRAIFIDPSPDPVKAYAQRKRLFEEGKDWLAYERNAISEGGGVFARNAKRIAINEAMRRALGLDEAIEALSGEELIRAILCAPVELLYNGGIGTYVKAQAETHEEVRDPANNAVRVNAEDLRCRVVLEGGNLGFTQKARLVFAQRSGLINTDAIDNAAGVHISDREVNLKLLFYTAGIRGKRRNRWLQRLSDAVLKVCLAANEAQARALSLAERDAMIHRPRLERLTKRLTRTRMLNPFIASGIEPANLHLRPALSVLLGQEKNRLQHALIREGFRSRSIFAEALLLDYFPKELMRRHKQAAFRHPLAEEIVAVQAANRLVNQIGLAAASSIEDMLDAPLADIVEALLIGEYLFDAPSLREAIWQQATDADLAIELHHGLSEQLIRCAEELLRLCPLHALSQEALKALRRTLRRFALRLAPQDASSEEMRRRLAQLRTLSEAGLAPDVAARWIAAPELSGMLAPALRLHVHEGIAFARALHLMRRLFEALPLVALDAELRSNIWGEHEAHLLRRLLLARLAQLKARAAKLAHENPALFGAWAEASIGVRETIKTLGHEKGEARRMRLLLSFEQLEQIVFA